jgi:hypothetical protein
MSVLAFELVARLALPLDTKRTIYATTRDIFTYHDNHILYDAELGFVLRPNVAYGLHNLEYRITVSTNSLGFRDDEESLHQPSVLCIGDSFAFGSGVASGSTVSDFLESRLGCRVLNAGIPQYGTLQELRLLKRLAAAGLPSDCIAFVFFYAGNDLRNNVNRYNSRDSFRPYVEERLGRYQVVNPTKRGFSEWRTQVSRNRYPALCQYSYVAYIFAQAWKLAMAFKNEPPAPRLVDFSETLSALRFTISDFSVTSPIDIDRIVFVYVPTRKYYEESSYRKRANEKFERVYEIMAANSFEVVDLRGILSREDYHKYDGHWTPTGHRKAASALVNFMQRTGRISDLGEATGP